MVTSESGDESSASEDPSSGGELIPIDPPQQDSDPSSSSSAQQDESPSEDVEEIVSLVFARIENKLEQHLHTQMELPDPVQAAELHEKAPEIYALWIKLAEQKAETEAYVQRAQYEVPERLAAGGRPWAIGALFIVLGFCAYLATFGGGAIYTAGVVAALDVVAMLGLFLGYRPELAAEEKRSNKKLPPDEEKPNPSPENSGK